MTSTNTSGSGRHTAQKNAARDLSARTGMTYTAALRQVQLAAKPPQPRHRWILTDDVRAWFAGEGWRGRGYHNLYDWLDNEVNPSYECHWCGEPGDARETDSTIKLVITTYDPDLSPATAHIATHKHHASCQPSSIAWAQPAIVPTGPHRIGLPASMKPEEVGEFELDVRPLLHTDPEDDTQQALLLITTRVTEDHGEGARPWLTELELHLNAEGFGRNGSITTGEGNEWALRITTDYPSSLAPQWLALRTAPVEEGTTPEHLFLGVFDLPATWTDVARRDGTVVLVIGPCTSHWDIADLLDLDERIDDAVYNASCHCAALTPDHVAELVDAGTFLVSPLPVAPDATPSSSS